MHISLIGMSNIGKTFCSRHLAAHQGYEHIDCDALIEERLAPDLAQGGYHGIQGIAKWMGFPGDFAYKKNSRRYVDCERDVTKESLARVRNDKATPIVLDTTGSVVYTGDDVLDELRATTRVIYFEASPEHVSAMFKNFIAFPKPVIWGENFAPREGEIPRETLQRCYPDLLKDRAARYKRTAHVTIPFDVLKQHWDDIGPFILAHA